jgi:uncharacterized protein
MSLAPRSPSAGEAPEVQAGSMAAPRGVCVTEAGRAPMWLLPQRALYLPAHGWLLVADAHIGKAHSFRRLGVPVPTGTTDETLTRLEAALATVQATLQATARSLGGAVPLQGIVFLGDLLHARRGRSVQSLAAFTRWRANHAALRLMLVRGNHDDHAGDPPPDWGVQAVDGPLRLAGPGGLALAHEPRPLAGAYVLAGHLPPAVSLAGRAHQRLRLPCFLLGADVGVLPAFGAFTGAAVVRPRAGDRCYAVAPEGVHALPAALG